MKEPNIVPLIIFNGGLKKLKKDLLQNKYNLTKLGLYIGLIKQGIENLLIALKDYEND